MATLTGSTIASTYTQLLKLTSATLGADASAKYIEDGAGTDSALSISTTRVGIGTASPAYPLDVSGDIRALSGNIYLSGASVIKNVNNALLLDATSGQYIALRPNNGVEALRIDSAGNVGIGTSSPATLLDVRASSDNSTETLAEFYELSGNAFGGTTIGLTGGSAYVDINSTGGASKVYLDSNGDSYLTGGNVGIGTASPDKLLEVSGATAIIRSTWTGASSAGVGGAVQVVQDDGAAMSSGDRIGYYMFAGAEDSASTIHSSASINAYATENWSASANGTKLDFEVTANGATGRSKAMTIDSAGNVGIGTASPSYTLDVAGNIGYSGTITDYSDRRLKENINDADLDTCYDTVKNLKLKRYKFKDGVLEEKQDRNQLGWIAQEVEEVMPKSIFKHEYKYNQVYEDEIIEAVEAVDSVKWADEPTEENTKDEIKAWMDSNGLEYNSGDTKSDLIAKIPEFEQEAIVAKEERVKQKLVSEDVLEDCYGLSKDQIYATMFGAIQKLQAKVEALESK